jgi:hypothetical protein
MKTILSLLLISSFTSPAVWARLPDCEFSTAVGSSCEAPILDVHPTQFAVGFLEVENKISKIRKMDTAELQEHLTKKIVPVVRGPAGQLYMTDHHHLSLALYSLKFQYLLVRIQQDWSHLSESEFWKKMDGSKLVYPFDENGQGPLAYSRLPQNVYRGFAWVVEEEKAFKKSDYPYAIFLWGNFFRKHVPYKLLEENFKEAVKQGVKKARSTEAQHLPGYAG